MTGFASVSLAFAMAALFAAVMAHKARASPPERT
jgi:hypothetical protein